MKFEHNPQIYTRKYTFVLCLAISNCNQSGKILFVVQAPTLTALYWKTIKRALVQACAESRNFSLLSRLFHALLKLFGSFILELNSRLFLSFPDLYRDGGSGGGRENPTSQFLRGRHLRHSGGG